MRVRRKTDLRYAGMWPEIAGLPNDFQDQCVSDVTATYTPEDNGDVQVVNGCRNTRGDLRPPRASDVA